MPVGPLEPWVETVGSGDDRRLGALAEIYAEAFPDSERKPPAFLEEAAKRDDYALLALVDGSGMAGLAVVYRSPSAPIALLEYLAVSAGRRRRGLGAALFRAVAAANAGRILLLEVETGKPGDSAASSRGRRKAFYRKLGCRELAGIDYRMPTVSSASPPPMSRLACGASGDGLDRADVRAWLAEILDRVYAVQDPEGPVDEMLGRSADRIALV